MEARLGLATISTRERFLRHRIKRGRPRLLSAFLLVSTRCRAFSGGGHGQSSFRKFSGSRGGAVFLSYAREESDAARGLAEKLRAAGIEAWFDQSELRGGDAWDQMIRRQIKDCTLFRPIVSAHTQARGEG